MARSVPIWKILRFAKVSLYLERFVPRHATAHIHNVTRNRLAHFRIIISLFLTLLFLVFIRKNSVEILGLKSS